MFLYKSIKNIFKAYSDKSQNRRFNLFHQKFDITTDTKILDLGGATGEHMNRLLHGTKAIPGNIYIADIDSLTVNKCRAFGYTPVIVNEDGKIPYTDKYFDIVYSNSVIEHVTCLKNEIYQISEEIFSSKSKQNQLRFASEIRRISKSYFVQTPNKWFILESHTWLPLAGMIPRAFAKQIIRITNSFWVKGTVPDWSLLDLHAMKKLFPDAKTWKERTLLGVKSIVCYKP